MDSQEIDSEDKLHQLCEQIRLQRQRGASESISKEQEEKVDNAQRFEIHDLVISRLLIGILSPRLTDK